MVIYSGSGDLAIEMLPARQGDAILLSWGPADDRHRMLVDAGPARAYDLVSRRLAEVAEEGSLDLFVMTHIDADHIEGSILLTNDAGLGVGIKEIWFNGPAQLARELGQEHGEMFAALISGRGIPWNARFEGRAVRADDDEPLPVHELPGGLRLTVLGPDRTDLLRLKDNWLTAVEEEGLAYSSAEEALAALRARKSLRTAQTYLSEEERPDIYALARTASQNDTSVTNASSIVLLAEYGDASVLLAGDATPASLSRATRRLLKERGGVDQLAITAFKLPHHGSARNVTRDVVKALPAAAYLFSSGGGSHGRPHGVAVARCLEFGNAHAELVFNYQTPQTLLWDDEVLIPELGYRVRYPTDEELSVVLSTTELVAP